MTMKSYERKYLDPVTPASKMTPSDWRKGWRVITSVLQKNER